MSTVVIMPGGFHPFHAGHAALYQSAVKAFPGAEVFVAATNDTSNRPFPFAIKEKLAKLAGVAPGHFVQVKSPFRAEEITSQFDPAKDRLIFVRSEKDANKPPQAGGNKKDGSPAYLQPLAGQTNIRPFKEHAYMAYLPTVEFGPGMTSATEIRTAWPTLNDKRKTALVMSLYPDTQRNPKLAANVVAMLDTAIGNESMAEGLNEAVSSNYLYHATGGLKEILQSGAINAALGPQDSTKAQTKLPTVSTTRDWGYASGSNAEAQGGGISRIAVIVLDRNAVEQKYKTLGTSQSKDVRGQAFPDAGNLKMGQVARSYDIDKSGDLTKADADAVFAKGTMKAPGLPGTLASRQQVGQELGQAKQDYYRPKAGGEFEEAVVVPKGSLPIQGIMVGFWVNPRGPLAKDPEIMNHPMRLEMTRPNTFVKASDNTAPAARAPVPLDQRKLNRKAGQELAKQKAIAYKQGVAEMDAQNFVGGMTASYQQRENQPIDEDYIDEKWSQKYKSSINCANPRGFSQRAHCAGRKK